ncbi:hypothetical protein [Sulfoacidibacillus ferrooxidans]|nr:hypothetical protein [Sulfoacidibacillus ferrooxidans]
MNKWLDGGLFLMQVAIQVFILHNRVHGLGWREIVLMPLIHGGTEPNDITSTNYNLCYQILNTCVNMHYESSVGGLHAVPGDNMYVDIWFTVDSSTGQGTAHFYYHDLKNGNAISFNVSGITSYSGYNSTSEWIVERPTVINSTTENMADYGSVTFTGEDGTSSGTSYPTTQNVGYAYTIQPSDNHILSEVTTPMNSTGNVTVHWVQYN